MNETTLVGRELSVSLTVADPEASAVWYQKVLGFAVRQRFEREGTLMAVSLRSGQVSILVTRDDGARGEGRAKGEGFSIQITTDADIDAVAAHVRAHGGVLDSEPETFRWGQRAFRLRDPDGFKFTISSVRPE